MRRELIFFLVVIATMTWACDEPVDTFDFGKPADELAVLGDAGPPKEGGPPPAAAPTPFSCEPGHMGATGDRTITLTMGEEKRTVFVHVPTSYDAKKGTQLILGFHGYGGNAEGMKTQTGLDGESDKRGFIVAYAQGTGVASKGFNGGDCCGKPAWTANTDDVGFAREIVKLLSVEYCVDPKRVYSAGFSNGGFMSYRFVCEAADVFAAVASVSGVLGLPPEECKPSRPVPIFHIHGTADKTVAFTGGGAAGGLGALVNIKFRSVADSVGTFQSQWSCAATSKELVSEGDTRCEEWNGCQGKARIELCTVTDGGHQWPGGKGNPGGGKTAEFGTTNAVLEFFAANPMP
jgi:polyhydroxybutyrate depolymerase